MALYLPDGLKAINLRREAADKKVSSVALQIKMRLSKNRIDYIEPGMPTRTWAWHRARVSISPGRVAGDRLFYCYVTVFVPRLPAGAFWISREWLPSILLYQSIVGEDLGELFIFGGSQRHQGPYGAEPWRL